VYTACHDKDGSLLWVINSMYFKDSVKENLLNVAFAAHDSFTISRYGNLNEFTKIITGGIER